jgi:hypothetical protein
LRAQEKEALLFEKRSKNFQQIRLAFPLVSSPSMKSLISTKS